MTCSIVYIYPPGEQYTEYAFRFVNSYKENPAAVDHQSIVVLNGHPLTTEIECLFSSLRNVKFLERDNSGYDIGAFQEASRKFPFDLMAFFGVSTYFKGPGWLLRMLRARLKHGNALCGTMGNRGVPSCKVEPHVRTTCFWLPSETMNQYPIQITRADQRYEYEHGKTGLSSWAYANGLKVLVVGWNGEYEWKDWDTIPNGYHRGDQSDLLCADRLCCPPYYHVC